jgi:menaquinone-dependent protoporphyrinogen oxidase
MGRLTMPGKVLIAYGTKYGSTKEIAEKIGEALQGEGLETDVMAADKVKDLAAYKNIVIGTAVYMGMGRKEVKNFLKDKAAALKERNVWFFATGPSGQGDPIQLVKGEVVPVNMKDLVAAVKPRDVTVFHGNMDAAKMGGMEKFIVKRVGGETGDFRDWDMITSWAKNIASTIRGQ